MRFYTLRRNKSEISKMQELSKQYEGFGAMFMYFKDNSFINQDFLFLFVIRYCLFNLILATLSDYPLAQAILIMSMSALMLIYLLIQRPFKTIVNQLQHIVYEVIYLIVNTCVLIVAQINFENSGSYPFRDQLCEVVIYTSLVFSFIPQAFLGIKVMVAAMEWYRTSNNKVSQQNLKDDPMPTVQKRIRKENTTQFPKYQGQLLDESSAALSISHDSSNIYLYNQEVSFNKPTSQLDISLQANNKTSTDIIIPQQRQEFQMGNYLRRMRENDHRRFNQHLDNQTSDILRPNEAQNGNKEKNKPEKRANLSQNNKGRKNIEKRKFNR